MCRTTLLPVNAVHSNGSRLLVVQSKLVSMLLFRALKQVEMTHVGLLSVDLASLISLSSSLCADMTPCMSPLPQDGHLQDKSSPSLGLIQEETEVINSIMGNGVVDTSTGGLSQKIYTKIQSVSRSWGV